MMKKSHDPGRVRKKGDYPLDNWSGSMCSTR